MNSDGRRRFGAVASLVFGLFAALSLVPGLPTGPVGDSLGAFLWQALGIGALGLPLLGFMVGLAGFDRLPLLDMKRAAILVLGLSLLVPFLIGVISGVTADAFTPFREQWEAPARLTGIAPAFLARSVAGVVGQLGGVLIGFLALTGLTLATIAWHPLQRLEAGGRTAPADRRAGGQAGRAAKVGPADDDVDTDEEDEEVDDAAPARRAARVPARPKQAKPPKELPPRVVAPDVLAQLPPIDLLVPPPKQDTAADEAALDRLGELLLEAMRTFKVEGSIAGRTSGPVVTQFEVVPASGVKVGRIVALSDDLAIKMRTPSVRVAPIPGKGAVGVEVPNPTARMVTLREVLEAPEWDRKSVV